MGRFNNPVNVGLRDRVTRDLVAVYPEKVWGPDEEVYKKVKDWYYMQSCSAEDELRGYFVDTVTDKEFESMKR